MCVVLTLSFNSYLLFVYHEFVYVNIFLCKYFWLPALESNVIFLSVFFRLNGVKFSFADVLFITSVLTICMIILVVTVCFCVTSTTTNHVRYISSPFFFKLSKFSVTHLGRFWLADFDISEKYLWTRTYHLWWHHLKKTQNPSRQVG